MAFGHGRRMLPRRRLFIQSFLVDYIDPWLNHLDIGCIFMILLLIIPVQSFLSNGAIALQTE